MKIDNKLKKYIEENIIVLYDKNNYGGHGWSHIESVIERCFELLDKFNLELNHDMVYTIAVYHDIGYRKDPDNHEEVSSEIFMKDKFMKEFFSEEQRKIIKEAIIDHRASLEYVARSDYGKLVSSADREISVDNMLERSINFQIEKHKSEEPSINEIIDYSFKKLSSKYGKGGYAKMYFCDDKYEEYLNNMQELFSDKNKFVNAERNIIFSNPELIKNNFIDKSLKNYIEGNIFTKYKENDKGHGIEHINYVIDRSLKFSKEIDNINLNMVYVIAAYHDIGHSVDPKNHEEVSAQILLNDNELSKYFSKKEILIMSQAIEDHRASLEYEPRSIYGKIVSSADRNTKLEIPFKRTYEYRKKHYSNANLKQIIDESYEHLLNKFGKKGYAKEKMYFEDVEYKIFLEELGKLLENRIEFDKKYIEVNGLENEIIKSQIESYITFNEQEEVYSQIKSENKDISLDELLYKVYKNSDLKFYSFDKAKEIILKAIDIDEIKYYTKNVNKDLIEYIEENIFPQYEVNDKAHGIVHIMEVIRRSFALNDTFKLNLDINMVYAIAAYHDLGKHENHEIHEKIAADKFYSDENMKKFFTDEQRLIIKEAIEDHRSSKEDSPRSDYGKLISSADRNTTIDIVFIRSFFVAHERMPETIIEDYLDYTIKRLSKKYSEDNPENMFYEDDIYKIFLEDMRDLLKKEDEFKKRYCQVNNITSRNNKVKDELGETSYIKRLVKNK